LKADKKDGKTKDRVENWKNNVNSLTKETKKQQKVLDGIHFEQNSSGGMGENRRDIFRLIVDRMIKDIESTLKCV
jgi:hypothetical protein